jgi:HNH endonuclease
MSTPCAIDGCETARRAQGLCMKHYDRARNAGLLVSLPKLPPTVRFWSKVEKTLNGCWLWGGSRSAAGYGMFYVGAGGRTLAHRYAYELVRGGVPHGRELDHLCRNPACVNPEHLEPVTHRTNVLRGTSPSALSATSSSCPNGHEYTPETTWLTPSGGRRCLTCFTAQRSRRNVNRRARRVAARRASA